MPMRPNRSGPRTVIACPGAATQSIKANNEGYSRLDDGDPASFWKAIPYLDRHFTHEDNSLHPQWIVIEFNEEKRINAVQLLWDNPAATSYHIQYARFDDISDIALNPAGMWRDFPMGATGGASGSKRVQKVAGVSLRRSPLVSLVIQGQSSLTNPLLQILSATPSRPASYAS